jgi:hypothetical protein
MITLIMILTLSTYSQVYEKLELSYNSVDLYSNDSTIEGSIKSYINLDILDGGYFVYFSSTNERVYHFIWENTPAYQINRISLKSNKDGTYKPEFLRFKGVVNIQTNDSLKSVKISLIDSDKFIMLKNTN